MPNPLRLGGARGPNGRTFDDLYNQLAALNAGLIGPNSILTLMRQSLYEINQTHYAIYSTITSIGATANEHLRVIRELAAYHVQLTEQLTALTTTGVAHLANLKRLNDYIVGTGAVQANRGEDIYDELLIIHGFLNQIRGYSSLQANFLEDMKPALDRLSDVTGNLATPPAAVTIKSLLVQLLACCEDAAAPGGGGVLPPADVCTVDGVAQAVQWDSFFDRGIQILNFQERQIFAGQFTLAPTSIQGVPIQVATEGGAWQIYRILGAHQLTLVFSWDFTGLAAQPVGFSLISAANGPVDVSKFGDFEPVGLGDMTKGCTTYELTNCAYVTEDIWRFYFSFAFPLGTIASAIPARVWFSLVNDVGCLS